MKFLRKLPVDFILTIVMILLITILPEYSGWLSDMSHGIRVLWQLGFSLIIFLCFLILSATLPLNISIPPEFRAEIYYVLGFITTLVSLVVLMSFSFEIKSSSNATKDMLNSFSLAMISTILGLIFREISLSIHRQSEKNQQQINPKELEKTISLTQGALVTISDNYKAFSQEVDKTSSLTSNQLNTARELMELLSKLASYNPELTSRFEVTQAALETIKGITEKIITLNVDHLATPEQIEAHIVGIRDLNRHLSASAPVIQETVTQLKSAAEQVSEIGIVNAELAKTSSNIEQALGSNVSFLEKIDESLNDITKNQKTLATTLSDMQDPQLQHELHQKFTGNVNEFSARLEQVRDQIEKLETTINRFTNSTMRK